MLGSQGQLFLMSQGLGHRFRPIGQGKQITILVQLDAPTGHAQMLHSQLLTLSKRQLSSTNPE
ncbi:hypothetical protein D3C85_1591490 [compost metagenome]